MKRRYPSTSLVLAFLFGWLCWGVGESQAQESSKKPTVGLFPLQSVTRSLPQKELDSLSRGLLYQFRQNRPYPLSRKYPLVGSPPKTAPAVNNVQKQEKQMKPLYQQLNLSVKLMQKGRYRLALPQLNKGIKMAKKLIKWKGSVKTLARLRGLLALAKLQLGNTEEGETVLQQLARMDPQPLPPELQKGGPLKRLYKRSQREVNRGPKVRLQVIGTSDSTVYINGRKRGKIPLDIGSLPKGVHYVRVEKDGHKTWSQAVLLSGAVTRKQVTLKANTVRQITPLDQAKSAVKTNILLLQLESRALRDAIPEICKATQINLLLGGHLKKVGDQYYLFTPIVMNCKSQKVKKGESIQLNTDLLDVDAPMYQAYIKLIKGQKKAQVATLIRRRPPPRRDITRRPPPRRRDPIVAGTPVHKTWWFWTLITVGVVGGAAAATTVVLLNQPPRITINSDWSSIQ